jgi:hypothetical protein
VTALLSPIRVPRLGAPVSVPNLTGVTLDFSQPGFGSQDATHRFLKITSEADKGGGLAGFKGLFVDLDHSVVTAVSGSIWKKGRPPGGPFRYDFGGAFSGRTDVIPAVLYYGVIGGGDFDCSVISGHPADYESANAAQNARPWLYSGSDSYYSVRPIDENPRPPILIHMDGDNTDVVFHQVVR